jgi:hypothetical protein
VAESERQPGLALSALATASTLRAYCPLALRGRDLARGEGVSLCAKVGKCGP